MKPTGGISARMGSRKRVMEIILPPGYAFDLFFFLLGKSGFHESVFQNVTLI